MEFSIESKIARKKRRFTISRENMIKNEKLHMHDKKNYEAFLELYLKYGKSLTEEEFAYIFLDYSKEDYENVKKGYSYPILKNEEIDPIMVELLKIMLIKQLGLEKGESISAEKLEKIYNTISTNLSLVLFAENVLDVSSHSISCIKSDHSKNATIFNKTNNLYFTDKSFNYLRVVASRQINQRKKLIQGLKDSIAIEMNLHIGDKISCEQFKDIYEMYGRNHFSCYDFARIVLGLSEGKARGLINGKIENAAIWRREHISLEYIHNLRKNVIEGQKLHINDQIDYKRFKELYAKYSGILSEIVFAEQVLDISRNTYRVLRKGKCKSRILTDIDVPSKYWEETRKKIKQVENVYRGKKVTYEEFIELYKKYGFVTWDVDFASKVLQMRPDQFRTLKSGENKTSRIFYTDKTISVEDDYNEVELRKLRDIVLKENRLHIGDSISGKRFLEIYQKYGFGMSQKNFGEKILDIENYRISAILRNKNDNACVLTKEIVDREYLKNLRGKLFKSGEYHTGDKINYDEFLRLYKIYGGKLSELQFSEKVLFIGRQSLKYIRSDPEHQRETEIFCRLKLSDTYIANLKRKVINEYLLFSKLRITPAFFNRLYTKTRTILSKADFAKKILDISQQVYYKSCIKHENETFVILSSTETPDNKDKFMSQQGKRLETLLMEGYSYAEIEAATNFTATQVKERANSIFRFSENKNEIIEKYLYNRIKANKPIESDRLGDFKVSPESIEKIKEQIREEEVFYETERQCKSIVDEFKVGKNAIKNVRTYIDLCIKRFENNFGKMTDETLENLQTALEFLNINNPEYNNFFIRVCIERKNYRRANGFISYCMQTPNLKEDTKRSLTALRNSIKYAIKVDKAVDMLKHNKSIREIMYDTDLNEIEILRLKRELVFEREK